MLLAKYPTEYLSPMQLIDLSAELSSMRYLARLDAEHSIRIKDYFGYGNSEFTYKQLDHMLLEYFNNADDKAFPEWPYDWTLVDPAEFEYTPVVFSDGSTIDEDDTVDVPF